MGEGCSTCMPEFYWCVKIGFEKFPSHELETCFLRGEGRGLLADLQQVEVLPVEYNSFFALYRKTNEFHFKIFNE